MKSRSSDGCTADTRVVGYEYIPAPSEIRRRFAPCNLAIETVRSGRAEINRAIGTGGGRFIVVVGPCSIHDSSAALEYAHWLAPLAQQYAEWLNVVMRVYFEKPMTTHGWKGLILDPDLDGSSDMGKGLLLARQLLVDINRLGLPVATEFLDPLVPQYIADLVSFGMLGARTTESQTHRMMASGLSMPVGYKNSTSGSVDVAISAMLAAASPSNFIGINHEGRICRVATSGNPDGCLVLRGSSVGRNNDTDSILSASRALLANGVPTGILVDCSHDNSGKDYRRQGENFRLVVAQHLSGVPVIGAMLESNLHEGKQLLGQRPSLLRHGVSITDACIGLEETLELLKFAVTNLGGSRSSAA